MSGRFFGLRIIVTHKQIFNKKKIKQANKKYQRKVFNLNSTPEQMASAMSFWVLSALAKPGIEGNKFRLLQVEVGI